MTDSAELIERGLQAWARGDLAALEAILDPQVTLTWVEPGPWYCTNRDEVMRLLRQRQAERGFGPPERGFGPPERMQVRGVDAVRRPGTRPGSFTGASGSRPQQTLG